VSRPLIGLKLGFERGDGFCEVHGSSLQRHTSLRGEEESRQTTSNQLQRHFENDKAASGFPVADCGRLPGRRPDASDPPAPPGRLGGPSFFLVPQFLTSPFPRIPCLHERLRPKSADPGVHPAASHRVSNQIKEGLGRYTDPKLTVVTLECLGGPSWNAVARSHQSRTRRNPEAQVLSQAIAFAVVIQRPIPRSVCRQAQTS